VSSEEVLERIATDIEMVKRLLVAALMRDGMSQETVARALGVNQSSVSRMFSADATIKRSRALPKRGREG